MEFIEELAQRIIQQARDSARDPYSSASRLTIDAVVLAEEVLRLRKLACDGKVLVEAELLCAQVTISSAALVNAVDPEGMIDSTCRGLRNDMLKKWRLYLSAKSLLPKIEKLSNITRDADKNAEDIFPPKKAVAGTSMICMACGCGKDDVY